MSQEGQPTPAQDSLSAQQPAPAERSAGPTPEPDASPVPEANASPVPEANASPTPEPNASPTPAGGAPGLSEEDVMDALSNVIDPELGLDFVELGLIYGVEIEQGEVHVTFTLTTPGCPIGPHVNEQIEEFVGELEGVRSITSEMVFTPPWSPEMMSEDAKFALGF